jgi:ABC-type nickel/cobalt efflux system permease component RcnA
VVGVLAVAVHLGLGGTVLANSRWTGGAVGIALAIVLGKVLVIALGLVAIRRGKAAHPTAHFRARMQHLVGHPDHHNHDRPYDKEPQHDESHEEESPREHR